MEELLLVLMMIACIFILLLFLQKLWNIKFCALCGAVAVSWVTLLLLYRAGIFSNRFLIALLVGQTIVGIYYVVEKKISKQLTLFRLPFLLTLIVLGFSLLEFNVNTISSILFVAIIWILFIFIYFFRQHRKLKNITKKMIECCKKW